MLELSDLALFFGLLWFGWYALQVAKLKEATLQLVLRRCEADGVQLLDSTVVLRKLGLARDASGWLRLRRIYTFEFTATGADRYPGMVSMLGGRLEAMDLAPHRIH